jgi:two-component system invasion response regulator UvrY
MHRILIIDDHTIVRRGIRTITEDALKDIEIREAGSALEGLATLRAHPADLVVLDIGLPDRNGLELLKQIRQEWPRLPVLILSMHHEDQYGLRAMQAGAAGYLNKASVPENLVLAILKVRAGGRYISPELAEKLVEHVSGVTVEQPHLTLSDREFQILCMIGSGKTVSEIAHALCLSVKTISTYRARILEKMHLKNNAELTYYAISHQLVD